MKQITRNIASFFTNKKTYYVFLFIYFGFMTIPQWFYPFPSLSFVWILTFPVIAILLVVIGIQGIIGIMVSKANKIQPDPKYISFAQIFGVGLLAFAVFITIAYGIGFLYSHQKFNSVIWRDTNSSRRSDDLTPRQRMLDDLVKNILPGKNKDEIEILLGKSEDSENKPHVIYMLGPDKSLFSLDGEYIIIWFDDSGNFERYEIMPG